MFKYDSTNCLVNLGNSILKRFNAPTFHSSIPTVDNLLSKKKKVVLFLFDGMGKNVLMANKEETKNLRAHIYTDICSTFPPTTAAATNALLSAKYPNETGWFAWSQPFNHWKQCINVFPNTDSQTGEKVPGFNYRQIAKYDLLSEMINKANNKTMAWTFYEYPLVPDGHKNFEEMFDKVKNTFKTVNEGFIYAYALEPDRSSHGFGIDSKEVKSILSDIDTRLDKFAKENPDLLVLAIADHGHINVDCIELDQYPDLLETLEVPHYTFEGRCMNFKVKENKHKEFKTLFHKYFDQYFELYTRQEVLDLELFGPNPMDAKYDDFLGDYFGIAISNKIVIPNKELSFFKGHHAGGTVEEGVVSLIAYNYEEK